MPIDRFNRNYQTIPAVIVAQFDSVIATGDFFGISEDSPLTNAKKVFGEPYAPDPGVDSDITILGYGTSLASGVTPLILTQC